MPSSDPSRSKILRERWERDLKKRFRTLIRRIDDYLITKDRLSLRHSQPFVNTRSPDEKLQNFKKWLNHQIKIVTGTEKHWEMYVREAYLKGGKRAFDQTKAGRMTSINNALAQAAFDGSKKQFVKSLFMVGVAKEKINLMASRVFTDLQGITATMSAQITSILTQGLIEGVNPRVLAREMVSRIKTIGVTRSLTMARTELIRVHAEAQLDAFEVLDVKELEVMAEWSTAGDRRVCRLCKPLEGKVMSSKDARGLIPKHPNCRCIWIPANVGE